MSKGIAITDKAAGRIRQMTTIISQGVRVKIVGGGCSGLQYKLNLDFPTSGDRVFEKEGAKVIVDNKTLLYLLDTVMDYKEDTMQSSFVFENPNVTKSCGCGISFTVKKNEQNDSTKINK